MDYRKVAIEVPYTQFNLRKVLIHILFTSEELNDSFTIKRCFFVISETEFINL